MGYKEKRACVDTAGPKELLKGEKPIKIKPGEKITFVMNYKPNPNEFHVIQMTENKEKEVDLSSLVTLLILGAMILGGSSIRLMILFLNKNSLYLQILCGGLLTGMFAFELLPEVFSHFQTIGIFIMITMEIFLHNKSHLHQGNQETLYLLFIALIIHSITTGVTFGISLQQGQLINYGLLAAFILHHIPEGMIVMSLIPITKMKNRFFTIFCSTLSIVIGMNIFMGLNMRLDSIKRNTVRMGMTIGTMGYVTFYELLWKKSKNLPKGKVAFCVVLGMVGIHIFYVFFRYIIKMRIRISKN
ncbi:ZIP family metal transporter [Neobacillus sp. C211]|uniref:ZIP family metal transporter n=1 Tax=unclassified Neobacillus TaxID=2675272 RepID=UPI00397B18E5